MSRNTVLVLLLGGMLLRCSGPEALRCAQGAEEGRSPLEDRIATVQLFPTGAEEAPPVLVLGQEQTLTLAFDWLGADPPPPLEVIFLHLDRHGRPDLLPAQYMVRFDRDVIRDYRPSMRTRLPYYHVRYRFPNEQIAFRLSGQYLVRVLESRTGAVLLERRFYVSEQNLEARLALEPWAFVRGQFGAPVLRLRPPEFVLNPIGDLRACFALNGRLEAPQCPAPALLESPWMEYRPAPEELFASFAGEPFVLDLTRLEGARSPRIEQVDFSPPQVRVLLEPDRLSTPTGGDVPLFFTSGGLIERYGSRANAALTAEYVDVVFRLELPAENPLEGPVFLVGSFNDFRPAPEYRMEYDPSSRRYQLTVRLKQGLYTYQYVTLDGRTGRLRPVFDRPLWGEVLYTALVYYTDPRIPADRLLWVGSLLP